MSRTPSDASPSPDRFTTTSLPSTSNKTKVLHKGRKHDEIRSGSKSSSTHHERLSYSRSPSPPPTYHGGDNTAPSLGMIMDALTELRKDMDKMKKENKAMKSKPLHNNDPQSVSHNTLVTDYQESQAGFSGFRTPLREDSDVEEEIQDVPHDSLLLQGAKNYGPTENVSKELDKEIATMVNHLFINGMRQEDYKAIVEDEVTFRPNNCHALNLVDCNPQILDALPAEAKKADFHLREVGKDITKAATIVVKSLTVLDKVACDEEHQIIANEVAKLNGALALLGNAHHRNNLTRRHIIKRDINKKYSHLCADKAPMTGLLFGDDLSQATKNIEEADRLKTKFTVKKTTPWTASSGRFGGSKQRNFFAKASSRGFSSRYQPYGFRKMNYSGENRRTYPAQAWTTKNVRGRGQHNPRR